MFFLCVLREREKVGFFLSSEREKKNEKKNKKRKKKLTVGELAERVPLRVSRALVHHQVERREPPVRRQQPLDPVRVPVARQPADKHLVGPVGDRRPHGAEPRGVDARVRVGRAEQGRGGGVVIVGPADAEPGAAEGDAWEVFGGGDGGGEKGGEFFCSTGKEKKTKELERKT